jgi:sensor histidine kinase YesM
MHLHKYDVRSQVKESILIFLFGAIPMGYLICRPCFKDFNIGFPVALFSGLMWLFLWKGNEYIYITTDRYVSWFKTPVKRMFIGLGLMIAYSSIVVTVLTFIFFIFIFNQEIDDNFFAELRQTALFSIIVCTIIMLFFTARGFLLAWRQTAIDAERLQREHISSQYEALKNQVNPHFLFNSLNALSSLVYDHPKKAVEFINRLSDVYRYVLDSRDKEVVTLSEEMAFVSSYSFLLAARFESNLNIKNDVDGKAGYIPPMALQMLIENAVKHNEISDAYPLEIYIYEDDGYIYIKNRVHPKKQKNDTSGIGLENIKSRYSVLSDLPVKVERSHEEFCVGLPLLQIR